MHLLYLSCTSLCPCCGTKHSTESQLGVKATLFCWVCWSDSIWALLILIYLYAAFLYVCSSLSLLLGSIPMAAFSFKAFVINRCPAITFCAAFATLHTLSMSLHCNSTLVMWLKPVRSVSCCLPRWLAARPVRLVCVFSMGRSFLRSTEKPDREKY